MCQNGERLKSEALHANKAIGMRIITLQKRWKKLNELCANRRQKLEEGVELQQASEFFCKHEFYIYKRMCVCVYVHVHVCMPVCHACTYICKFVCMYVYMYVCST